MDSKGQSALEYLMTYGWALIVIAIVIGVLIFVTSGSTGGVTCQSRGTQLVLREWTVTRGPDGVGLVLQNATGGTITFVEATSGDSFQSDRNAAISSSTVAAGSNMVVANLGGPSTSGSFTNGDVNVHFRTAGGLDANVAVVCNGSVA